MNQMVPTLSFPKGSEIADALLLLLFQNGGKDCALRSSDTYDPLADVFNLDRRTRTVTRAEYLGNGPNVPYWHTLVQATREHLVKKNYLQGPVVIGLWMLTEDGQARAKEIAERLSKEVFVH